LLWTSLVSMVKLAIISYLYIFVHTYNLRFVIILFRLNLPLFCYEIGSNMYLFIPFNRTVNPSGALDFTPVFCGVRIVRSLIFCVMFCRPLLVYLSFMFSSLCCLLKRNCSNSYWTSACQEWSFVAWWRAIISDYIYLPTFYYISL
jgi:hypothetical protein